MKLVRYEFKSDRTFGRLYDRNGKLICDTLEDTDRRLDKYLTVEDMKKRKVYGKTAIPAGTYRISYEYWAKHSAYYPLLHAVPAFTGIFIHGGVTPEHTLGCILVGTRQGDILTGSALAMQKVRNICQGGGVSIIISRDE